MDLDDEERQLSSSAAVSVCVDTRAIENLRPVFESSGISTSCTSSSAATASVQERQVWQGAGRKATNRTCSIIVLRVAVIGHSQGEGAGRERGDSTCFLAKAIYYLLRSFGQAR